MCEPVVFDTGGFLKGSLARSRRAGANCLTGLLRIVFTRDLRADAEAFMLRLEAVEVLPRALAVRKDLAFIFLDRLSKRLTGSCTG
jgi:hypothetical protein